MVRTPYLVAVTVLVALLTSIILALGVTPSAASAKGSSSAAIHEAQGVSWLGAWSASQQPPYEEGVSAEGFENQTVRNIVHTSAGGNEIRVRLSNAFGEEEVIFGNARVATQRDGAATEPGTDRELTFDGAPSVAVPAGEEVYSDPVYLDVAGGENLAVSLYLPEATGPTTWHELGQQSTYFSNPGDHTAESEATAFSGAETSFFFVSAVEVRAPEGANAIVAFGDSITDGFNSTLDANGRYPDYLADRMLGLPSGERTSVLNAGISGNRILNDAPCCGVRATDRLERDVLSQAGVSDVILLEGINDIGYSEIEEEDPTRGQTPDVSAEEIITGMQQIIDRSHAEGLQIHGGTLLPFEGADYYSEEGEAKRQEVNDFIRNSGEFDSVVDFDRATRDPENPRALLPEYDSGDNLHPNDAGYRAMAAVVDLERFDAAQGEAGERVERIPETGGIPLSIPSGGALILVCGLSVLAVRRRGAC